MKKSIKWVIFSFIVLFILPLLAAKFAGPSGMALCYIMFFAINPIFFIAEGIASGKAIKKFWYMPFGSALIYLLSMWIVFDMGESAFLLYAGTYFAIGTIVMLITSAICYVAAKKQIPKEKIINYTVLAIILIIVIAIISVFGVWKYNRTFTVHRWMENEENRHLIVNNMISKYEIVGMTEKEITELLGEEYDDAPESFKYPRGEFPDESTLTYYLGVDFMDNNWLIITIEDGKATSYAIGLT